MRVLVWTNLSSLSIAERLRHRLIKGCMWLSQLPYSSLPSVVLPFSLVPAPCCLTERLWELSSFSCSLYYCCFGKYFSRSPAKWEAEAGGGVAFLLNEAVTCSSQFNDARPLCSVSQSGEGSPLSSPARSVILASCPLKRCGYLRLSAEQWLPLGDAVWKGCVTFWGDTWLEEVDHWGWLRGSIGWPTFCSLSASWLRTWCDRLPRVPHATNFPPWYSLSPQTMSQDKDVPTQVASCLVFVIARRKLMNIKSQRHCLSFLIETDLNT